LLGRDVTRRAEDGQRSREIACCVEPFGQAEVAYERLAAAVEQDVTRFQVAMEDALAMRVARRASPSPSGGRFRAITRNAGPASCRLPPDAYFMLKKGTPSSLSPTRRWANVGLIEACRGFGFPPETGQRIARVGVITQDAFERDDAANAVAARGR
jgi:hypothetical protein